MQTRNENFKLIHVNHQTTHSLTKYKKNYNVHLGRSNTISNYYSHHNMKHKLNTRKNKQNCKKYNKFVAQILETYSSTLENLFLSKVQ